jgi:hypothetical protein
MTSYCCKNSFSRLCGKESQPQSDRDQRIPAGNPVCGKRAQKEDETAFLAMAGRCSLAVSNFVHGGLDIALPRLLEPCLNHIKAFL